MAIHGPARPGTGSPRGWWSTASRSCVRTCEATDDRVRPRSETITRSSPSDFAQLLWPHRSHEIPPMRHAPSRPTKGPSVDVGSLAHEVLTLAAHIDPEALDRLQRQWRSGGLVPAADAAGLLG